MTKALPDEVKILLTEPSTGAAMQAGSVGREEMGELLREAWAASKAREGVPVAFNSPEDSRRIPPKAVDEV